MNEGILILGSIAILFISMFVYSYSFEYLEIRKQKKLEQQRILKESQINEQKSLNEKIRNEKYSMLKKRSNEIKSEFERLSEFRKKTLQKYGSKIEHDSINMA